MLLRKTIRSYRFFSLCHKKTFFCSNSDSIELKALLSSCKDISEKLIAFIRPKDVTALIRTVKSIQETPESRKLLASKLFKSTKSRFPKWFQTWFLDAENDIKSSPVLFSSEMDKSAASSLEKALLDTRRHDSLGFIDQTLVGASIEETISMQNFSSGREVEAKALTMKVIKSISRNDLVDIVKCINSYANEDISEAVVQTQLIRLLGFHAELALSLIAYLGIKPSRKTLFVISKAESKRAETVIILTRELEAYINISDDSSKLSVDSSNDFTGGDEEHVWDGENDMRRFGTRHRLSVKIRCVRADLAILRPSSATDALQDFPTLTPQWTNLKTAVNGEGGDPRVNEGGKHNSFPFQILDGPQYISSMLKVKDEQTGQNSDEDDTKGGYWADEPTAESQYEVESTEMRNQDDEVPNEIADQPVEDTMSSFDEASAKRKVMLLNIPHGVDEEAIKWSLRKCGNFLDVHLIRLTPHPSLSPTSRSAPATHEDNSANEWNAPEAEEHSDVMNAAVGEEGLRVTGGGLELEETGMSELADVEVSAYSALADPPGPRNPLATLSAIKSVKHKGSKRIQEVVRADNHAFVWLADDASYSRMTRDDIRILGVCLQGQTCTVTPADKQHTLMIEINKMWTTARIKRFLGDAMDYAYHLDCPPEFDQNVPVFVQLNFATHEDAWKMYRVLRVTNTAQGESRRRKEDRSDSFIKVSWVKTKWYWAVAKKEKELIYDSNSLRRPSETLHSVVSENRKKLRGRIIS